MPGIRVNAIVTITVLRLTATIRTFAFGSLNSAPTPVLARIEMGHVAQPLGLAERTGTAKLPGDGGSACANCISR